MTQFDVVQAWLDNVAYSHSKNVNTGLVYRHSLEQFCKFIGETPESILEEYERSEEKDTRRKYAQLLRAFIGSLSREGMTVNTIDCKVGAIRSFFKHNDLPLGFVPIARKHVVYHNRDITKENILAILAVSSPRDKAFYCMMAQSGLRPETQCSLRLRHIEPDFSNGIIPCKVDVPEELTKGSYQSYFTFIGEDSIRYLKAYLTKRPGVTRESFLFTNHGTNEQANPKSFSRIFARTIQKLKEKGVLDYELRKDKPSELRLYNLRKYFNKHAEKMPNETKEFLMGHRQGVRDHYLPKDPEHYRQLYAENAMPHLRFETHTPDENEKQIQELREENKELKGRLEGLKEEVAKFVSEKGEEIGRQIQKQDVEFKERLRAFDQELNKAEIAFRVERLGQSQEEAERVVKTRRYITFEEAEELKKKGAKFSKEAEEVHERAKAARKYLQEKPKP